MRDEQERLAHSASKLFASVGFILTVMDIWLESLGRGLTKLETKFRKIPTAAVDLNGSGQKARRPS